MVSPKYAQPQTMLETVAFLKSEEDWLESLLSGRDRKIAIEVATVLGGANSVEVSSKIQTELPPDRRSGPRKGGATDGLQL